MDHEARFDKFTRWFYDGFDYDSEGITHEHKAVDLPDGITGEYMVLELGDTFWDISSSIATDYEHINLFIDADGDQEFHSYLKFEDYGFAEVTGCLNADGNQDTCSVSIKLHCYEGPDYVAWHTWINQRLRREAADEMLKDAADMYAGRFAHITGTPERDSLKQLVKATRELAAELDKPKPDVVEYKATDLPSLKSAFDDLIAPIAPIATAGIEGNQPLTPPDVDLVERRFSAPVYRTRANDDLGVVRITNAV